MRWRLLLAKYEFMFDKKMEINFEGECRSRQDSDAYILDGTDDEIFSFLLDYYEKDGSEFNEKEP